MGHPHQPSPPGLRWLGQALGAIPSDDADARYGYALMPSRARPQMVLPLADRGAGWAALHRHSEAAPLKVRMARELWACACRAGVAGTLTPPPLPDSAVGLRTGSVPWRDLIRDVFGRQDLGVAISVGQLRPQIKPILHVASKTGQPLGHIKVGWNDVTRSLVRHEAEILLALAGEGRAGRSEAGEDRQAAAAPLSSARALRLPRVLHHGNWHGREILAVSDIGGSPWYRRRRTDLPTAATRQAGQALGVERMALGASPFWADLSARAKRLTDHEAVDSDISAALATALDSMTARQTAVELDFGLLHGDWAPWNMAKVGSSLAVWDWERSRTRGPLGFDGAFFRFQVDLWIRGLAPEQALTTSQSVLPQTMAASCAPPEVGPVILQLVVLEVAVRQLEGLVDGAPVPERIYRTLSKLLSQALTVHGALAKRR